MSDTTPLASSLDEALPLLRRPYPPAALNFKIQAQGGPKDGPPSWAHVVPYLNARDIIGRLNHVVGGGWRADYRALEPELQPPRATGDGTVFVVCELTVLGVMRSDVGEASDDPDRLRAPKAAFSDALKRAAVHFGVGHVVYAMPRLLMDPGQGPGRLRVNSRGRLLLREENERHLRDRYAGWLEDEDVRLFGAVLDHGARAGAVGDEESGNPAESLATEQGESRPALRSVPAGEGAASLEQLRSAASRSGYGEEVLQGLADLLAGQSLGSLDGDQLELLSEQLARAAVGEVPPPLLAGQITKALQQGDREVATERFCAWLARRAAGAGERAATSRAA